MGNSNNYTVSVVIPVKDREESLFRAIESVKSQTFAVDQIIIVDDGSVKPVKNFVAKHFPDVEVIRNDISKGAPFSRNRGWQNATSNLIAFLDSDDEMSPDNLLNKVELLVEKGYDMVCGSIKLRDGSKVINSNFKTSDDKPLRDHLLLNSSFDARTSTFLVKRTVLEDISFDEILKKHQDWDLFINIENKYKVGYTNLCDVILHISEKDTISDNLKHESTKYFIDKNKDKVSVEAMFMFVLKMLYKSQIREDQDGIKIYSDILFTFRNKVSLRSELIIFLIKNKLLDIKILHKLKRLLKG